MEKKEILEKIIETSNKIHNDSSCSADCIIIESTNPHYDEIKRIFEERTAIRTVKVKEINRFRDGGTIVYKDDDGNSYWKDNRIKELEVNSVYSQENA